MLVDTNRPGYVALLCIPCMPILTSNPIIQVNTTITQSYIPASELSGNVQCFHVNLTVPVQDSTSSRFIDSYCGIGRQHNKIQIEWAVLDLLDCREIEQ